MKCEEMLHVRKTGPADHRTNNLKTFNLVTATEYLGEQVEGLAYNYFVLKVRVQSLGGLPAGGGWEWRGRVG